MRIGTDHTLAQHRREIRGRVGDLGRPGRTRLCARGSATGDFDGDGRLDLAVAAISGGARIFRNTTAAAGHSIEILLAAGPDRRTALGTKVRVVAGGRTQLQEFILQPSYASGSWVPLHFGLGSATRVQTIEVVPPGETKARWSLHDVAADRLYRLSDGALTELRAFRRAATSSGPHETSPPPPPLPPPHEASARQAQVERGDRAGQRVRTSLSFPRKREPSGTSTGVR
jgi:hypothetical protein